MACRRCVPLGWFVLAVAFHINGLAAAWGDNALFNVGLTDGTYIDKGQLGDWHHPAGRPQVNGKLLFDPANPARWMEQVGTEEPTLPDGFVEYLGGDRMPGRVLAYRTGTENWANRLPPHLLVRPSISIDLPDRETRATFPVKLEHLRRIVWQRRAVDTYQPSTLYFTDGREKTFRSLRWAPTGIVLLGKDGTERVVFDEIAELHLPERDAWNAYFDTLAELLPHVSLPPSQGGPNPGEELLLRIDALSGLVATTGQARLRGWAIGGEQRNWYHHLQPAWALEHLWIQQHAVKRWRIFSPYEPPITLFEPKATRDRAVLASAWDTRLDRSARDTTLRTGNKQFGWGLGVQANATVTVPVSPLVTTFRTRIGLDESAGRGGCSQGRVYATAVADPPLWQSTVLVGSNAVEDTGPINLQALPTKPTAIILLADMAHANRPPGADPFDIRDLVDWHEPTFALDANAVKAEIATRLPKTIAAWDGWVWKLEGAAQLQVTNGWQHSAEEADKQSRKQVLLIGGVGKLSRQLTVTAEEPYLGILIGRYAHIHWPCPIQVYVDGELYAEFVTTQFVSSFGEPPYLVSLAPLVGKTVTIDIVPKSENENQKMDYRGIALTSGALQTAWDRSATTGIAWQSLEARSGAKLERQYDGSIAAGGKDSPKDKYTLSGTLLKPNATGFRLDVIPDTRYPQNGAGRYADGVSHVNSFRVLVPGEDEPDAENDGDAPKLVPLRIARVQADHESDEGHSAGKLNDRKNETGWTTHPLQAEPHHVVFTMDGDLGAVPRPITITMAFNEDNHVLGRFAISVTDAVKPLTREAAPIIVHPQWVNGVRILFDEDESWGRAIPDGDGRIMPTADAASGKMAFRVTRGKRFSPNASGLQIRIVENPGKNEYRYVRFAWKKAEGQAVGLEFAHEGSFGPNGPKSFRYHAGPLEQLEGSSLQISKTLPIEWTTVTRDLFADFGEFTMTGLSHTVVEGNDALYDRMIFGPTIEALDNLK